VTTQQYPAGCSSSGTPCDANKLTATITVNVQSTFLRVLGFGNHTVTVSDTAFYLPPISLGQPGGQLGSTVDQLGTAGSYYFLRSEGYGNPRSEGDAFDPDNVQQSFSCNNSVTENTAGLGTSTDEHQISANNGTEVPNDESNPADPTLNDTPAPNTNMYGFRYYDALPKRGGYDFALDVPSGQHASPEVYNPSFAPDGGFNPYSNSSVANNMHEQDGSFSGNTYTDQYSAMEYTLFQVNDVFDHTQDTPLAQVVFDPLNITISSNAVSAITDVANGQTIPTTSSAFTYIVSNIYHAWVNVANPPVNSTKWTVNGTNYNIIHVIQSIGSGQVNGTGSVQEYRLRVDMLDYQGYRPVDDSSLGASPCSRAHKGYAVRLTQTVAGVDTLCSVCTVSGIDELAIYTPVQASNGGGFSIPVFNLPSDYKGTTVDFYVFDPGDLSSGTNLLSVIDPDTCATLTAPTVNIYDLGVQMSNAPSNRTLVNSLYGAGTQPSTTPPEAAVNTIVGGTNVFNGHWVLFQLPIPSNYAGGTGNCAGTGSYWALNYTVGNGGTATDTITMVVGYQGAPVHLLG
jgi:hypothetical protein